MNKGTKNNFIIKCVLLVAVIVIGVVAIFSKAVDRKEKEMLEEDYPKTTYEILASKDFEVSYPATPSEVDLRGMDCVEAICVLDRYMDEAMRSNASSVRIIHGKGTGALRAAVQQSLRKNKFVKKFRLGVYGEGEDGVTIAEFR